MWVAWEAGKGLHLVAFADIGPVGERDSGAITQIGMTELVAAVLERPDKKPYRKRCLGIGLGRKL